MIADVQVGTSGGNEMPQQASEQMEIWTTFGCRWGWTFKKLSKSQAKTPAGCLGEHPLYRTRAANKHVNIGYLSFLLISLSKL